MQTNGLVEPVGGTDSQNDKITELLRLKQELIAANSKIALQEQELAQTRVMKHTLDQALGPPSEADFGGREITEQTITHLQSAFNASNPAFGPIQDAWNTEDSQSDVSDALSAGAYNRARVFWNPVNGSSSYNTGTGNPPFDKACGELPRGLPSTGPDSSRFWGGSTAYSAFPPSGAIQSQRVFSGPATSAYSFYTRPFGEQSRYAQPSNPVPRRLNAQGNRGGQFFPVHNASWNAFAPGSPGDQAPKSPASPITRSSSGFQAVGVYPVPPYPARPVGTALSPTATEFTTSTNDSSWTTSSVGRSLVSLPFR